jgi:hypothetical protein
LIRNATDPIRLSFNAYGGQEARLRSSTQYSQSQIKPSMGALPTMVFAFMAWGAIFGVSWFAWQLMDFFR